VNKLSLTGYQIIAKVKHHGRERRAVSWQYFFPPPFLTRLWFFSFGFVYHGPGSLPGSNETTAVFLTCSKSIIVTNDCIPHHEILKGGTCTVRWYVSLLSNLTKWCYQDGLRATHSVSKDYVSNYKNSGHAAGMLDNISHLKLLLTALWRKRLSSDVPTSRLVK